jgi:hypothetical protein
MDTNSWKPKIIYRCFICVCLFTLSVANVWLFSGCQFDNLQEAASVPQPIRSSKIILPPDACTAHCVLINQAENMHYLTDRKTALTKIATIRELTLHEQLHLINAALPLEMFGLDEVFMELAQNRYLRYSAREYMSRWTDRLSHYYQDRLFKLFVAHKGVPDDLSPMEKLWCDYLGFNEYDLLEFYISGHSTNDILIIFYLTHCSGKTPATIADWRKTGLKWHEIAFDNCVLKGDRFFVTTPHDMLIPEPFTHAYELYRIWSEEGTKTQWLKLTDEEMLQLIQLKVVCEYYDAPVLDIMELIASGKPFAEVIKGLKRKPREKPR